MEVGTAKDKGDATVPAILTAAHKAVWTSGNSSVWTTHPMTDTHPGKQ